MAVVERPEVRRHRAVVLVAALAVGALGWWLGHDTPSPALLWDGTSYLALSRWVAGEHTPFLGYLGQYHLGYPALLAPAVWATSSFGGLVDGVRLVNAGALVASALALASIARTCRGGDRSATTVAMGAATALYGGLLLQVGFAWSEVAFAALTLAVAALLPAGHRWLPAALGVAAYAVHPRGAVVVAATFLVLAVAHRRRAWPVLAAIVVGAGAVYAVNQWAFVHLWHAGAPSQSGDVVRALVHPSLWGGTAKRAVGELWYVGCASLGLAPIGATVLVRWWRRGDPTRRLLAGWLLVVTAGLGALTATKFAEGGRVDQLAYGRYLDPVVPVLTIAGLVVLTQLPWRGVVRAVAGSAALTALAGWGLSAASSSALTGVVMPLNILGVFGLDPDATRLEVLPISLAALAALAVVTLATRRRALLGIAVVAAAFLAGDLGAQAGIDRFAENEAITFQLGPMLDLVAPGAPVSYDYDGYDGRAANLYELQARGHTFHYFDSRLGEAPPDDLVISTAPADEPPVAGARLVFPEPHVQQALWVTPGPMLRDLAARGFVLAEPGTSLPDAFYRARVAVTVEGSRRVRVDVTRTSTVAPWVRPGSINAPVGAVVLAVHVDGATTTVPFARTLFPTERTSVSVALDHPVPPGARVWAEVVAA
jgi:hypothetical protein